MAQLTGEPPFKLHYQVTHKQDRMRERTTTHTRVMQNTHDEIVFQPEQIGSYTWQAIRLEDASYKGSMAQNLLENSRLKAITTVHPLASAKWDTPRAEEAKNCEGKTVQAQVALTGDAPFSLEYQVAHGSKRETKVVKGLNSKSAVLDVDVPSKLDKNGGTMTLSLSGLLSVYNRFSYTYQTNSQQKSRMDVTARGLSRQTIWSSTFAAQNLQLEYTSVGKMVISHESSKGRMSRFLCV